MYTLKGIQCVTKKSTAFQIQINNNYKLFDCSQLLWVNDTGRKHVLIRLHFNAACTVQGI